MDITRRHLIQRGVAFGLGFAGLRALLSPGVAYADSLRLRVGYGFGPLVPDPKGMLDLPEGFSYRIISAFREVMDDGLTVPAKHDGMCAFPGPDGRTILIRNHEIDSTDGARGAFGSRGQKITDAIRSKMYDAGKGDVPALGGTTTLVYDTKTGTLERHFMSLAGTVYNCAGGVTPWGTWLTCEESMVRANDRYAKDHGYVFEVRPTIEPELQRAEPIEALGRFQHEAVAFDPASGIVYMTEDLADGLLYRFIPKVPGQLLAGGRLQCLMIKDRPRMDTRNWEQRVISRGESLPVEWFDVEDTFGANNDIRIVNHARGAALFGRGEGMWYTNGSIHFACTVGGRTKHGQIFKYTPSAKEGAPQERLSPGTLELFIEPDDGNVIGNCDNITAAPWGDLMVCEDSCFEDDRVNHLLGVTPDGEVYKLAKNSGSASELTGAAFSPDGTTLFVNRQGDGQTFAITGPWRT
jgi:secreted PhoX family phosphatase